MTSGQPISDEGYKKSVSLDVQYNYITNVIESRLAFTRSTFFAYVRYFSLLSGATIWLRNQFNFYPDELIRYLWLSSTAALILLIVCVGMIYIGLKSWQGYRIKLTELDTAPIEIPAPKSIWTGAETAMIFAIIASTGVFCWFNPFWS